METSGQSLLKRHAKQSTFLVLSWGKRTIVAFIQKHIVLGCFIISKDEGNDHGPWLSWFNLKHSP